MILNETTDVLVQNMDKLLKANETILEDKKKNENMFKKLLNEYNVHYNEVIKYISQGSGKN